MSDWRALDHETLEREYNARATVPDIDAQLQAYRDASAAMYQRLPCQRGLHYGLSADETLDLFPVPGRVDAPLFLFIHGGYWRALRKEDSVFMAQNFTAHGVAVAALDYSLAPEAHLSLMVEQCRRAAVWLHSHQAELAVDTRRLVVAGSSAGAHLAAMVLATGWQAAMGAPANLCQAGVLVSGLYDLEPIQATLPNSWLKLDPQQARALSPQYCLPDPACKLHLVVAERDTSEFKRQSRDFGRVCAAQGNTTVFEQIADRNHFDVILDWADPASAMTRMVLALFQPAGQPGC